jgi:hypothetical protein
VVATPDQIATLSAWWKADSIAQSDNTAVASWADSGSGGNTATQGTGANQPTLQTNEINGLPVVRFDGSTDFLNSAASASLTATTLFAVFKPSTVSGNASIRAAGNGSGGSGSGGLQWRLASGVPQFVKQAVANVATASGAALSTTAFTIISASFANNSTYAFYRNGAADGSGSHGQTLTAGTATNIGYNSDGGGERLAGDLAELIVYSSVLSTGDRASVHSYLQDKYGITVSDYVSSARGPAPGPSRFWPLIVR